MSLPLLAWLIAGFSLIVICHELTHILIARAHGHRLVCVAVNPVGAAVVFEDQPTTRYWCLQVLLPLLVTAAGSYLWLLGLVRARVTSWTVRSAKLFNRDPMGC